MSTPEIVARASSPLLANAAEKSGLEGRATAVWEGEAAELARRAAYADRVRGLQRGTRNAGFVASLVGVLVMTGSRYVAGMPAWGTWAGVAVILVGWALFTVSVFKRAAWVRAHPFDGDGGS